MKKSYLDLATQLISFDTVSFKSNSACASFIAQKLEDLGMKVSIEKFMDGHHLKEQIIGMIGPEVEDGLILSGHMDTVPFANQPGWTRDALKLHIENDRLYGRGTCDMKLFIAQCIEAMSGLDLTKLKKPIVCIFTADEETGCQGAHRLTTELKTLLGKMPMPKRAIIGEPTSFEIINSHKGVVHFDVMIQGKAGHSSRPDLGVNAISPLGKIITLINDINFEFQAKLHPEIKKAFPDFPYNYLHMATLRSGMALNMIPEKTTMQISYRSFPSDDPMMVFNYFQSKLLELGLTERVSLENIHNTPSMPLSNNPELEKLLKKISGVSTTRSVSFATDGGYLSQMGIECYVWGPGEIKMAHQPDEYMPMKDFIEGPEKLKEILKNLVF